ncbi:MAG: YdcF family protein [Caldilineaceae bacterium]|nr:YdcF family protein [Caldilineaceae bacterium]
MDELLSRRVAMLISAGAGMLLLLGGLLLGWPRWVESRYECAILPPEEALSERVAIVFGARIYASGRLSAMLRDRVDTAIDLYKAGKVEKLLMSGDNRFADYDEPGAMMAYAIAQGVPADDIQPDYGGRRTYDTCYRAKAIFQVDSAIVVTQRFHLPRALFLCDQLGIDVVGVAADRRTYDPRSIAYSETREIPALVAALIDVIRRAPPPVLGEPIPIE